MNGLPSPLIVPGRITTMLAPDEDERAWLAVALTVSWRSGEPIVPGFVPAGPGDVTLEAYDSDWIAWRCMAATVAAAAAIPDPMIRVRRRVDPLVSAQSDDHVPKYWDRFYIREIEESVKKEQVEKRERIPHLTVVFGMEGAAGQGHDALRRLYESFYDNIRRETRVRDPVLLVGVDAPPWADEYGPVLRLDLHNSMHWRDSLWRVSGGQQREIGRPAVERVELAGPFPAPERHQSLIPPSMDGPGVAFGYGAVFNEWSEVNHPLQGRFLRRFAASTFAKRLEQDLERVTALVAHGHDAEFGEQPIGTVVRLEEDSHGLYYEVRLLAADYTRALAPDLAGGLYRSSITFEVLTDELVVDPGRSDYNPEGLPELTYLEARCSEVGPCRYPAFAGTSAGIRLAD